MATAEYSRPNLFQRNAECMKSNSHEVADDEAKELDTCGDEVPMALCVVGSVSKQASSKPLVVLFDSGALHTWWNIKSLPKGTVPHLFLCRRCKDFFTTKRLPYFLNLKSKLQGAAVSALAFISRGETGGNKVIGGGPQCLPRL